MAKTVVCCKSVRLFSAWDENYVLNVSHWVKNSVFSEDTIAEGEQFLWKSKLFRCKKWRNKKRKDSDALNRITYKAFFFTKSTLFNSYCAKILWEIRTFIHFALFNFFLKNRWITKQFLWSTLRMFSTSVCRTVLKKRTARHRNECNNLGLWAEQTI